LQPANLFSFCLTLFGLLVVAVTALTTTLPLIKKRLTQPNLTRIGLVLMGLGGYFVVTTFYYYLTGGYSAHPSVWYEVIGPLHNPNLWVIALVFLGVPLIILGRTKKNSFPHT
jgi:hypothetical protein